MAAYTGQGLTGQEVVSGLAKKLRSKFSVTQFKEIYKDKPVQSMTTPCIFIHSIETTHTPEMGNYAWWNHLIDIRCHPSKMNTDIHSWARVLGPMIVECVQRITINNQEVKSRNLTWRVEDNVLHVIGSYRYRVVQTFEDVPDMQTLTYGERIKK